MIHVLGRVRMGDLATFLSSFATRGAEARRQHGGLGSQVFRVSDEANQVVVLLTWESRDAFEAFRTNPAVREAMRAGGVTEPPKFTFLDKVGDFPT